MLGDDEIGQTMVLLMRRKQDDVDPDTQTSNSNKTIPLSNPFIIGVTIDVAVGQEEAKKVLASKEGRGSRYLLRTKSKTAFHKLSKITKLTDGTEVEVIPHPTLNSVQGVVYEPDCKDVAESVILGYLKSQGVKSVRRITKRVNGDAQNTALIVLTFHGTCIPEYVLFGRLRVPVRTYYPSPMVCYNCGDYGHPRKFCKQSGICLHCSETHQLANGEKCNNTPHCKHCNGDHSSTSRTCSKYKDEENIIRMQIDKKISSAEARKMYFEKAKKETMASFVQKRLTPVETEKDKIIAELRAEVMSLKSQLTTIQNDYSRLSREDSQKGGQKERKQQAVTPTTSSSESSQISQRSSRKDRTFISPPNPHRSTKNKEINPDERRTRSRSRKHPIEISPTGTSHPQGKRASRRSSADDNAIEVDE